MSAEGCSSSESGWTMYIASPVDEDEPATAECSSEDEKKRRLAYRSYREDHDVDTDDSMASDASSGLTSHHNSAHSRRKDDAKEAATQRLAKKKQLASHHSSTAKKDQKRNREKSTRRK